VGDAIVRLYRLGVPIASPCTAGVISGAHTLYGDLIRVSSGHTLFVRAIAPNLRSSRRGQTEAFSGQDLQDSQDFWLKIILSILLILSIEYRCDCPALSTSTVQVTGDLLPEWKEAAHPIQSEI